MYRHSCQRYFKILPKMIFSPYVIILPLIISEEYFHLVSEKFKVLSFFFTKPLVYLPLMVPLHPLWPIQQSSSVTFYKDGACRDKSLISPVYIVSLHPPESGGLLKSSLVFRSSHRFSVCDLRWSWKTFAAKPLLFLFKWF